MIDCAAIRRKDVSSLQQGGPRQTVALNQPASMIPGAIRFKKDEWKKHLCIVPEI
ncbi:hypothetical protein [Burkholderia ubonensis]|uniref:hypothetical protein n=1 Tax=Burkholderia ubonensis TaxID=101571 RepID=UPI000AB8083E|nr:hypothetical protein [Burkholderia ubonensis]